MDGAGRARFERCHADCRVRAQPLAGVISANRGEIRPLLLNLEKDLHQLITSLDESTAIESVIADGRLGRKRIPGKHGGRPRDYHFLPIVIEDKAGQLAALFQSAQLRGLILKISRSNIHQDNSPDWSHWRYHAMMPKNYRSISYRAGGKFMLLAKRQRNLGEFNRLDLRLWALL